MEKRYKNYQDLYGLDFNFFWYVIESTFLVKSSKFHMNFFLKLKP